MESRRLIRPLVQEGGTFVRGNLCPRGAVLKQPAASPRLLHHRGPAFVFDHYDEMRARFR